MGWWSITDDRAGLSILSGEPEVETGMYMGDGPADIMGPAVMEIVELYQESWERKPYMRELEAALEFASGVHNLEETATPDDTKMKHLECWSVAKDSILEHAHRRIKNHTDAGGSDLEIITDTCKEIFDLCVRVAIGDITVDELPKKLEIEGEGGTNDGTSNS